MNAPIVPFAGSYRPGDVEFLLRRITLEMTPVDTKEALIQSGAAHYSDMLSQEPEPSLDHLRIFNQALDAGADRLARESLMLAAALLRECQGGPVVLASLVRAGVPLGVLLHRAIAVLGGTSYHYGISIVRDRGIDEVALRHIEARHGPDNIVFVDGWTGKGAIAGELTRALAGRPGYPDRPRLLVLADPGACAWLSASSDDWLIPFGILGAPVSGMVSRSVWAEGTLHGCVECKHLEAYDCSTGLVDRIAALWRDLDVASLPAIAPGTPEAAAVEASRAVVCTLQSRYSIDNPHRIKPGIAEATRAVLRRVPDHILVRTLDDPDVALLRHLAETKGIEITEAGELIGPYRAVTIIKKVT